MTWEVRTGDCVDLMAGMEPGSVDAVVCDPPYGLEFMGKEWDRLGPRTGKNPFDPHGQKFTAGGTVPLPPTPSYTRQRMPRCATCGGWKYNASKASECACAAPEWVTDTWTYPRKMQAWHEAWAVEALRVLKPGGHLLAFGGTRTSHRLACAIEDAGFEIRDTICWLYGSGFPKSLDVGKAIDKAAGAERPRVGTWTPTGTARLVGGANPDGIFTDYEGAELKGELPLTAPATPDAEQWDGWGTALKPAHEPIVVARKPLSGTVAQTVLEHGTGGLNVDRCRTETTDNLGGGAYAKDATARHDGTENWRYKRGRAGEYVQPSGRWPANVTLDEEAARQLDEQSGERPGGGYPAQRSSNAVYGITSGGTNGPRDMGDSGGASRFFYVAKASRAERNAGLDGFEEQAKPLMGEFTDNPGRITPKSSPTARANHHPTVKPVNLMRWLCRLATPPGGLVLDPFTGSGTTGIAAVLEGFNFAGCEQDDAYADIARARIGWWEQHGHDALRIVAEQEAAENEREAVRESGQMELL